MHTAYHKISARERDEAPRFYYKRAKRLTLCQRLRRVLRVLLAFLFTQVRQEVCVFDKVSLASLHVGPFVSDSNKVNVAAKRLMHRFLTFNERVWLSLLNNLRSLLQ